MKAFGFVVAIIVVPSYLVFPRTLDENRHTQLNIPPFFSCPAPRTAELLGCSLVPSVRGLELHGSCTRWP
jgi:hypothetical protein